MAAVSGSRHHGQNHLFVAYNANDENVTPGRLILATSRDGGASFLEKKFLSPEYDRPVFHATPLLGGIILSASLTWQRAWARSSPSVG